MHTYYPKHTKHMLIRLKNASAEQIFPAFRPQSPKSTWRSNLQWKRPHWTCASGKCISICNFRRAVRPSHPFGRILVLRLRRRMFGCSMGLGPGFDSLGTATSTECAFECDFWLTDSWLCRQLCPASICTVHICGYRAICLALYILVFSISLNHFKVKHFHCTSFLYGSII